MIFCLSVKKNSSHSLNIIQLSMEFKPDEYQKLTKNQTSKNRNVSISFRAVVLKLWVATFPFVVVYNLLGSTLNLVFDSLTLKMGGSHDHQSVSKGPGSGVTSLRSTHLVYNQSEKWVEPCTVKG